MQQGMIGSCRLGGWLLLAETRGLMANKTQHHNLPWCTPSQLPRTATKGFRRRSRPPPRCTGTSP